MYVQSHPGRVITKYHFNEIFAKAWLKSMVPANIISGFKTGGINPFNPKEVLDHDSTKEKSTQGDRVPMIDDPITDDCEVCLHGTVETSTEATFAAEEETLFTR